MRNASSDRRVPQAPASWLVELQRSPMLTILSSGGILMLLLVVIGFLPTYFLVPGTLLVAVVANNEARPILAERRLAAIGQVLPAVVTKLEPMKKIRKHPLEAKWTVAYRYSVAGAAERGRSRALPWQVLDGLEVGDEIAIRVHPERPDVSVWIAGG